REGSDELRGISPPREDARLAAERRRRAAPALQPRGKRADQVAPDRRLAEDSCGAQPTHGGGGMIIRGVALIAVALSLLAAPLAAEAQQTTKVISIGYLSFPSLSANAARIEAFRQGLRELSYVDGKNIVIEWRSADGKPDRLPALAAELVRLKVAVIVTSG